jgi:hypothetical protein
MGNMSSAAIIFLVLSIVIGVVFGMSTYAIAAGVLMLILVAIVRFTGILPELAEMVGVDCRLVLQGGFNVREPHISAIRTALVRCRIDHYWRVIDSDTVRRRSK